MRSRTAWTCLVIAATLVSACVEVVVEDTTTSSAPEATTTTEATATSTTSAPTTTTTAGTTTTVAASTTTTGSGGLPGEPIEFGPAAGDTVAVVGVAHDDVLNLRAVPGAKKDILEGIPPLADSLTARGNTRQLANSFWIEVDYADTQGWVNLRYIAYLGDTDDITAAIVEQLGETPIEETMEELGMLVAESVAGNPSADIVMSVAPTIGPIAEVTFDITGFEDDSVRGGRFHVFGQAGDDGFTLEAVEATPFCARGVDDGACV